MKNMKITCLLFGLSLAANASALTLVDNEGFNYSIGGVIEQPNSFPFGPTTPIAHYQAKCTVDGANGSADCRLIFDPKYGEVSITTIANDAYYAWSCLGVWDGQGFDANCVSNDPDPKRSHWQSRFSELNFLPLSKSALGSDPARER
jgi:hypothetical protein